MRCLEILNVMLYVACTCQHLHQRIDEHKGSLIGIHMREHHGESTTRTESSFSIRRKFRGKYECLLYEICSTLGD